MFVFQTQGSGVIVQASKLCFPEIPLARRFTPLLFLDGRHPDEGELILLTLQVPAQPGAQGSSIQTVVFATPLWVQQYRANDQVVGAGGQQLIVQCVAEAASFIDRPDDVAFGNTLAYPLQELFDMPG